MSKKIFLGVLCIGIILGLVWFFFLQNKQTKIDEELAPTLIPISEASVGTKVGAFTITKIIPSSNPADVFAWMEFSGTTTIDVECSWQGEMYGYGCTPLGDSIKHIPGFLGIESAGSELAYGMLRPWPNSPDVHVKFDALLEKSKTPQALTVTIVGLRIARGGSDSDGTRVMISDVQKK
jgi:hypothetical protein